jgi:acetoacetyl-CoA synthetase
MALRRYLPLATIGRAALTMAPTPEPEVLWRPNASVADRSNLTRYLQWLSKNYDVRFHTYREVYDWSVTEIDDFWRSMAEFFDVQFHTQSDRAVIWQRVDDARWFPGATLNYAEQVLRAIRQRPEEIAILSSVEGQDQSQRRRIKGSELISQVKAVAAALRAAGVEKGDRVAGYLPNCPETVIVFLASASIGAIWSSCPPELSSQGVLERWQQIGPKVLFGVSGYHYASKYHDRSEPLREITNGLSSLKAVVMVGDNPVLSGLVKPVPLKPWADFIRGVDQHSFSVLPVEFDHPLWILFSSGTTGIPKPIVQSHGGILLEHLKVLALQLDLQPGDRFFWYTTSGWMMWNFLVTGLALGTCIVLYDGSPKHPDLSVLWRFVDEERITYFGTSAPFLLACEKAGLIPRAHLSFSHLRSIGSTGAPLPPEGFDWVYQQVKPDVWLGSASGGTDVCTAFVVSNPLDPVIRGKLQCRALGARIEAWNENGETVWNEMGELVLTAPFPSMPVFFWNDPDGGRLRASYFDYFPGIWRHGDWIEINPDDGQCVIYGRSDSTLNRGGVRMGTSEFYRVVEAFPEIQEALVIDTTGLKPGATECSGRLVLFVVLAAGVDFTPALKTAICDRIKTQLSPRYVPDDVCVVNEVPHTLNGKKLEVPVKRIFQGVPLNKAVSREALSNPQVLNEFVDLAKTMEQNTPA